MSPRQTSRVSFARKSRLALRRFSRVSGVNLPRLGVGKKTRRRMRDMVRTKKAKKKLGHQAIECRAGSESMFKILIPPKGTPAKLASKLSHMSFNVNDKAGLSITAGLQNFAQLGSIFNPSHCGTMLNQVLKQEFLYNTTITIGATSGNIGLPTGYQTLGVNYTSCHAEFGMANSSNACVRGIIYDVIQKRDSYLDANNHSLDTVNAIKYGIVEQGGATTDYQVVGTRPFDSNLFNQYFKVKRITYFCLSPGQTHYHRVTYKPNKRMNSDVIRTNNQLNVGMGGFTYHCLLQFSGIPVPDNGGAATTEQAKLVMVSRYDYKYNYLPNNMSSGVTTNNLSTTVGTNFENTESATATAYAVAS